MKMCSTKKRFISLDDETINKVSFRVFNELKSSLKDFKKHGFTCCEIEVNFHFIAR